MSERIVTCRYTKPFGHQCTAEAVDPEAEILLCTAHLAAAQRLIQDAMAKPRTAANR